jgi:CPA2 family monovalent cation:H+ antiporter-2
MIVDLTIVLLLAFIGGFISRKLKQPLLLGYLVSGFMASLFLRGLIHDTKTLLSIAEIGIALLLFTVGLDLNFSYFKKVLPFALVTSITQIIIVTLFFRIVLPLFGIHGTEAFIVSVAFSFSSTTIIVKLLQDKGMGDTFSGMFITSWLLIQDLAVIPILILLPVISGSGTFNIYTLCASIVFILLLVLLGKRLVPILFEHIAKTNSHELLLISVVLFCFGIALLSQLIGLSIAIGAFVAGLLVSELTENHEIFTQVRPLKEVFASVFFVSLPFFIQPDFLMQKLPFILGLTILVLLIKFLVSYITSAGIGVHKKVSYTCAFALVSIGEFSFILATESLLRGGISSHTYSVLLLVTIITLVLSPFFFVFGISSYSKARSKVGFPRVPLYFPYFKSQLRETEARYEENLPLKDHVVLCGFGRMGRYVGKALSYTNIPYIVVEIDRYLAAELTRSNIPVVYGDPSERDILDYAQVDFAKLLIIAVPDTDSQRAIITNAKTLNRHIHIISRSHFESDQKNLKSIGADTIIQPEFSAALEVVVRALRMYGLNDEIISGKIARLKIEHGLA